MSSENELELSEVPLPLVVTAGDPAGIGGEVIHKAIMRLLRRKEILSERPVVVVGDAFLYVKHLKKPSEMQKYHIVPADDFIGDFAYLVQHLSPAPGAPWRPIFLDCGAKDDGKLRLGHEQKYAGERALVYLGVAVELLAEGLADAVCTGPICKAAARKAGFHFPGQTELFAHVCDRKHPVMMLVGGGLRVALVTIHEPLARVAKLITRKSVRRTIETTRRALRIDFGIENPRIAVCGLNPHAGENGKFGSEERRTITPALKTLRDRGIDVAGPISADSLFAPRSRKRYDAIVAMYHDQGLIPVKTLAFDQGVNMTLGLPIVRTAPDHGTAFDIVGEDQADDGAMLEALLAAHEISLRREKTPAQVRG